MASWVGAFTKSAPRSDPKPIPRATRQETRFPVGERWLDIDMAHSSDLSVLCVTLAGEKYSRAIAFLLQAAERHGPCQNSFHSLRSIARWASGWARWSITGTLVL